MDCNSTTAAPTDPITKDKNVSMDYRPVFAMKRGEVLESLHFGAVAVVDASGTLLASLGDPQIVTFLRSSAKPFQALPFIERGGHRAFNLTAEEIALICASHSGTDRHVDVVTRIQRKVGLREENLQCGTHPPYDDATRQRLFLAGESPTPNRHNCSGKHTGMLAHARLRDLPLETYLDVAHPVQRDILQTFAGMCDLPPEDIAIGVDGCSAPNFAVPLYHAALAYARLCDPRRLPAARAEACRTIIASMTSHPEMVAGPGRFDTRLMEVGGGRVVAKSGAEGYLAMGLMPGTLNEDSPGVGIAIKISDGDHAVSEPGGRRRGRVRPAVALEVLRQLGALGDDCLEQLEEFGPRLPVYNWRMLTVGESYPLFHLHVYNNDT